MITKDETSLPVTFTIAPATPTITTAASGTVVLGSGGKLTASAILSGGVNATGTITFTLTDPHGAVVDTETAAVNDNGTYSTPNGYLPGVAGTYRWSASYSGDGNNAGTAAPAFPLAPTSTLTGLYDIYQLAVDSKGNLYVAESLPGRVAVFPAAPAPRAS